MRITYLAHSGFLIETPREYLLFDYFEGDFPTMDPSKPLYVFVSHKHPDHYNYDIWKMFGSYQNVTYILARDIPFSENVKKKFGITEELSGRIVRTSSNAEYVVGDKEHPLMIKTYHSTDEGVAFLVMADEKSIYHAGDLNLWVWKEESKQFNENMIKKFTKQMELLGQEKIDVAFLPLDYRQEENAGDGMDYFLEHIGAHAIFPMHLWDRYDLIAEYCTSRQAQYEISVIRRVEYKGQIFEI